MSLRTRFAMLRPYIDAATDTALTSSLARICPSEGARPFIDALHVAARGGKRFRALLANLGYSIASGTPLDQAHLPHLSAALELYQASALVHDDIIDNADTRRGVPTTHVTLSRHHHDNSWSSSPSTFGKSAAILVGDFLFSAAQDAASRQALELESSNRRSVFLARFNDMHAEVGLGQYLDIVAEQKPLDSRDAHALTIDDALEVALHKSAHYSVVHPTVLGALCGLDSNEAEHPLVRTLTDILTPWGLAFQLRDDDLGVFGSPDRTGKPAGDDLREGKRTVLLACTWKRAHEEERAFLTSLLGDAEASVDAIAQGADIIARRGRDAHEDMITRLTSQGHAAMEKSALGEEAQRALTELCEILTQRDA